MNLKICYLKIDVSCGASGNFQCISQNATPATEFAPCHSLTQPWQCDSQKTSYKTRLKCRACDAKWRSQSPNCCAPPENATHLLTPSQTYCACHTKYGTTHVLNVTKCHACHAKRSYATLETSKSDPFCRTFHRHGHTALTRTVADVANGCTTSSENSKTSPFKTFNQTEP